LRFLCVGLHWKTPISLRERLAFDKQATEQALQDLKHRHEDSEFAILSTCNRTEIYAAGPQGAREIRGDEIIHFLSDFHDVSMDEFVPHLYTYENAKASNHLFEVASGLDSLVLGEVQILGQVKEAYEQAVSSQVAGPILHTIFQKAFNVAKRVQTETGLSRGRLSIASAAVDYIKGVFEIFRDKTVLVIGAGKMAELTVKHLQELHPARILVVNRNIDRAQALADRFGGESWSFNRLQEGLIEADIVVSSTAADEPIIHAAEFAQVMKARRQRLIAIIDIAVPRDFDDAIGEMANVLLWNIDDLERVRHQTIRTRRSELLAASNIVSEELKQLDTQLALLQSGPIIGLLDREYQRVIDDELAWLLPQLNGISESQREKIKHFTHRMKNKLLHAPKATIRDELKHGRAGALELIQRLFGLGDRK
jgi:glutamyl-tRNA reductase